MSRSTRWVIAAAVVVVLALAGVFGWIIYLRTQNEAKARESCEQLLELLDGEDPDGDVIREYSEDIVREQTPAEVIEDCEERVS
jgi:predicted negative regulator of RcsB-dependent stress response